MITKVLALELKLDSDPLPFARIELPLSLAAGEPGLHCLDHVPQRARDHAEEEDNALLVHGFVAQPSNIGTA